MGHLGLVLACSYFRQDNFGLHFCVTFLNRISLGAAIGFDRRFQNSDGGSFFRQRGLTQTRFLTVHVQYGYRDQNNTSPGPSRHGGEGGGGSRGRPAPSPMTSAGRCIFVFLTLARPMKFNGEFAHSKIWVQTHSACNTIATTGANPVHPDNKRCAVRCSIVL